MSPRSLKIALGLSLALNLVVAGAVVGARLSGGPPGRDGGTGRSEIGAIARGLDAPTRRAMGRALRDDPAIRADRAAMRAAQSELRAALVADPFDRAALLDAMRARQALQGRLTDRGFEAFADAVAGMTPEARAELAARMSRRRPQG
ncbi:periplasmic heavy metal sensor [uncultured Jannaschia sp.]|uniref:periplasmic heavy metal sensor n=1 Tax=uncultured Jannaschia sp. TaxID=293347 RepID=UPI002627C810|nr:periplasmic heavy metal sensor [uncultured Jannaschia sp.]